MGSTSSVYLGTDYQENSETNDANPEPIEEDSAISLLGNSSGRSSETSQTLAKVQLNHSISMPADRLSQNPESKSVGFSVQYLVEENLRLKLANQQLISELRKGKTEDDDQRKVDDRDAIFGETTEQRLSRLEKHLESERREKWSAIENSERARVDLVNCERELEKSNKTIETLAKELESNKSNIEQLEETIRKLKKRNSDDEDETLDEAQAERKASMSQFRADLKAKREARQRALSSISTELNNLREELQCEKSLRKKLEEELKTQKLIISDGSVESIISDNATLKNEISILTENIEKLNGFSTENIRLKFEIKNLQDEMDSLNSSLGELKFEYYEEKRKHERTLRKLKEFEENKTDGVESRSEWEEEKEKFFEQYDREKEETNIRTNALKDVIKITRQMLTIRENQVQELKNKLKDIEDSVKNSGWEGLKEEYEKQLENIKNLRLLYDERVKLMDAEKEKLQESLQDKIMKIKQQTDEIEKLNNQVESYQEKLKSEREERDSLDRELRLTIANTKDLENEINLINNLFTQMLLGSYNTGNEVDLDKLTELLQENHDLITEMTTREDSSEIASVLPKLLLDLITQVDVINEKDDDFLEIESSDTISEQSESALEGNQGAVLPILSYKNATLFKSPAVEIEIKSDEERTPQENKTNEHLSPAVQEIASNLPKVWRVLMELLSHHSAPEEPTPGDEKQCYKSVDTPYGPRSVISVSNTFIRLKDLILEKKSLQKELTRLKQLNSHLENRLDDQEKRLSQVQCELHKTWGIVGRMRAQHQQLHNHEKILRFELQEKRVMLCELKQELEYCREKWEKARQKNDESETEWKKLRREFAARKSKGHLLSDLNDSGESGFSDEQNESGEDCENFDADRSNTQSPVDQKLLETSEDSTKTQIEISSSNQTDFVKNENTNTTTGQENPNEGTSVAPVEVSAQLSQGDFAEELAKQSESNLKQTTENVEDTKLEECTEVSEPGCSTSNVQVKQISSQEEERARAREARELRLQKLEEQCKLLVRKVDITTHKSNYLNNRLEELHDQYGGSEDKKKGSKTTETSEEEGATVQEEASTSETECTKNGCEGSENPNRTFKDEKDN